MKTTNLPIVASLCAILLSLFATGCSSNDEPYDSTKNEYIRACYSVNLAQSWYDLYDIVVTYTDVKGETKSVSITGNYDYDEYISANEASKTYSLNVTAKPKSQAPTLDQNASYNLDRNCAVNIYKCTKARAITQTLHTVGNSSSLSTTASELQDQITNQHTIFHTSYSLTI